MTHAPSSDPVEPPSSPSPAGQGQGGGGEDEASYTCRRCRTELFTEGHLERHAAGAQAIARRKKGDLASGACTSLFLSEAAVEGLPWLQATLAAGADEDEGNNGVEGKLCCPNARCRTRLGGFNWSGSQCSCGSWVVPAVQVVASRVDRKGREETSGMVVVDFKAVAAAAAVAGAGGGRQAQGQQDEGAGEAAAAAAAGAAVSSGV